MRFLYIDPPSGWKYGFPKRMPESVKDVNTWLIDNGYPKEIIDQLGDSFYFRMWKAEDED